jgi:hypothetical protein
MSEHMPFLHDPETHADTAEKRVKARTRKNCIFLDCFVTGGEFSVIPCRYADMQSKLLFFKLHFYFSSFANKRVIQLLLFSSSLVYITVIFADLAVWMILQINANG